jgi:hypothetical protein
VIGEVYLLTALLCLDVSIDLIYMSLDPVIIAALADCLDDLVRTRPLVDDQDIHRAALVGLAPDEHAQNIGFPPLGHPKSNFGNHKQLKSNQLQNTPDFSAEARKTQYPAC